MQSTEQILASTPGSSQLPTSSQTPSRVLVVEPHPTLRTVLVQRLRQDGHLAAAVGSAAEAVDLCREQSPDLLVSAEILEQNTAMRLAQQLGSSVIVLTARSGVDFSSAVNQGDNRDRVAYMVIPRVTTAQRDAFRDGYTQSTTIIDGSMIYNTTLNEFQVRKAGAWVNLSTS